MDHEARPRSPLGRALLEASSEAAPPPPDFASLVRPGSARPGLARPRSAPLVILARFGALAACLAAVLVLAPVSGGPGPLASDSQVSFLDGEDAARLLGREAGLEAFLVAYPELGDGTTATEAVLEDEILSYVEGLWGREDPRALDPGQGG